MAINIGKVYSTLGNPKSLIPLAVKDCSATAGMTAGSFITGKEEGQDRFIDEMGTEIIWLGGIPAFKWLYDKTVFKALGLDSNFDARILKNKDIFEKAKEFAPEESIKKNIEKISKKQNLFKNATTAKFFVSTSLAVSSYVLLTKFKQKFTENKIRQNLINEFNKQEDLKKDKNNKKQENKTPSFKGVGSAIENFAFNPVKNMWILDGSITAERLKDSRSPQELFGYAIKELSTLCFMYYAGEKIQEQLEKRAKEKHNKTIGLDARVIENNLVKNAFDNDIAAKDIEEFNAIKDSDVKLYEFLHKNPNNLVVKVAKESELIKMYKKSNNIKTDKIDTRRFIDLNEIKNIETKLSTLLQEYNESIQKGVTSEKFFNGVKKLKRHSILNNIGACIFALGIATPGLMLFKRLSGKNDEEFQTKKQIREQLIKEGIIK